MQKLVSILLVVMFLVIHAFSSDSLYSSCGDNLVGNAGEWVEAHYCVGGENLYSVIVNVNDGCFGNVLDSVSFILDDKSFQHNGYDIICSFEQPAPNMIQVFTIKGKIKAASSNPYDQGGSIKFMVRAVINGRDSLSKQFGLSRADNRTFGDVMGNGTNRIMYKGVSGYLVFHGSYTNEFMISDSGKRFCIPWFRNSFTASIDYTGAVVNGWGWDGVLAKEVPIEEMQKYPLVENVLVKPGYCVLYNATLKKYYESTSLGVLREISKEQADHHNSGEIIPIPDCFLVDYSIEAVTGNSPDSAYLIQGKYLQSGGQDFIKIVYGSDTISVKNIQSLVGFPYFAYAGFPTGEHMGGGPGFCLTDCRPWNGEDDFFLELSFNKTSAAEWNFKQAIYRVNKNGESFLVCESSRVYELVATFGENILAVDAVYSANKDISALLSVFYEVYSKDGALLYSEGYPLSLISSQILASFKLKQDTVLFVVTHYSASQELLSDTGHIILPPIPSTKLLIPAKAVIEKFSAQNAAYFDMQGRKINSRNVRNLARGQIIFRKVNGGVAKINPNFNRQLR